MRYTYRILGVPKIMRISDKQAVDGIRSEINIKVGSVLRIFRFFLSNEQKNSAFL